MNSAAERRALFLTTIFLLVLGVCVGGAEIAARAYGRQPRRTSLRPVPVMQTPDAVLGWKNVAGTYVGGPYVADGDAVTMTVRADGARSTGSPPVPGRPALLLVGCSFTFGWAVADDETWGARIQQSRPDLSVSNRGVEGYGTYQSLLLMERLLVDEAQRPTWILYGDIGHDLRNAGALAWLSTRADIPHAAAVPSASLRANGILVRHPPLRYPSLPLHDQLASVALIENLWTRWQLRDRTTASPRQLTDRLLVEMADVANRFGVKFSIVILTLEEHVKRARMAFAQQNHIDVIDCNQRLSPTLTVAGEGHPNALAHQRWADCIATALAQPQRWPPR
jgi:hypothetical protein